MNIENKQPQVNEFLKRAKEAEALADSVDDPAARQAWIRSQYSIATWPPYMPGAVNAKIREIFASRKPN